MPTDPILSFDTLIAPIPGDNPAGSSVPFAVTQQLEEMRREVDPDSFSKDDPTRPEAKKADWKGTIELTQETLRSTSKDLLIAARLTEALVKVHGFAGLRDGLRLFRMLADQCWDRMFPVIDAEDDLEIRAARFNWLDDKDKGARFPGTLRMVPLMDPGGLQFGWQHWKDSQGSGKSKITTADIERAIQITPVDKCQLLVEDMEESGKELAGLTQVLSQKMATPTKNYAPGLVGIREAMNDCRTLAQQVLQKKGGGKKVAEPQGAPPGPEETGQAPSAPAAPRLETRAEIYARVAEAAAKLQQIEPHSPIPYLLNRAVELGTMPFPDLMKSLILNPDVLKVMNRELGIKEQPEKK
jgi:type VI secretion system protein ImpA